MMISPGLTHKGKKTANGDQPLIVGNRKKLLILGRGSIISGLLKKYFEKDFNVEVVSNGKEGLNKVINDYFDVIISDIEMPLMDGIEFYRHALRNDPEIRDRIFFYIGSFSAEQYDFILKHNLQYVIKPATMWALKQAVNKIINKKGQCCYKIPIVRMK